MILSIHAHLNTGRLVSARALAAAVAAAVLAPRCRTSCMCCMIGYLQLGKTEMKPTFVLSKPQGQDGNGHYIYVASKIEAQLGKA